MYNIVPKDIFQNIVDSIRTELACTATQSSGITYLHFNTTGLKIGNYVNVNCGAMQGDYMIKETYTNRIGVRYSGAFSNGTVKTTPFFQWGNLKDGRLSISSLNEFPLIYFILPTPYEVNVDKEVLYLINHTFQFLIIDRIERNEGERTLTDSIYNNTVSAASELGLEFIEAIKGDNNILRGATFRRSEEIPFGITFSGDSGSTETLIEDAAGCYIEASVKIKKKYC